MRCFVIALFLGCPIVACAQSVELWGLTTYGGAGGKGTIFKINGDGSGFSNEYDLSDGLSRGSLTAVGSLLVGTTVDGGVNDLGSIFSYDPFTDVYTTLFSMDTVSGFSPYCGLMKASNGLLYGVTSQGGMLNKGVIFEFNLAGNVYSIKHQFDGPDGENPVGKLYQASNGLIYGMTSSGGPLFAGVIYSYDLISDSFNVVHYLGTSQGSGPMGSLIESGLGSLYGMTFSGGLNGVGTIFSINMVSGNHTIIRHLDMPDGIWPMGAMCFMNGKYYGCTNTGGLNNKGVLFRMNGSNFQYTPFYLDDSTGTQPWGSPMAASDGKIYLLCPVAGTNGLGTITRYDPQMNTFIKLFDFDYVTGTSPYGDLIEFYGPVGLPSSTTVLHSTFLAPNPCVDGIVHITLDPNAHSQVMLSIFNIAGKEVFNDQFNTVETSCKINLSAGIYCARLTTGKGLYYQNLVVY